MPKRITFPYVLGADAREGRSSIRQVAQPCYEMQGELTPFTAPGVRGHLFRPATGDGEVLLVAKKQPRARNERVIQATYDHTKDAIDLRSGTWLRHPDKATREGVEPALVESVLESWNGAFSYVEEDPAAGVVGFRQPQVGAVHAVHAHWSVSDSPATVVMPTGTGKTEVMLGVLVSARCSKVLLVVPTDALRTQLSEKFLTLGILKDPASNILRADAAYPVVCTLRQTPKNIEEVDRIFTRAQIILTTSSIAGRCDQPLKDRMADHCPYLFIDEAHHVEAPTWKAFKESFRDRRVLQFTATPFREDGRALEGQIIFNYPLRKAQNDGYFRKIRFLQVVEFNKNRSDEAIAAKAVEQLRADADKGHILMARVESIARARKVFEIYEQFGEFSPVQLHTGITSVRERERIRQRILSGESRIIVCVDMLGEGFDLPELKIAAFHDIRKTLAVTLQIAGRFIRNRPDLGDPTFIANTADVDVQDELRKLYTRDPDWNLLLPELSERIIGEELSLQDFLQGFSDFPDIVPLKTVRPALSTVVYRTTCEDWNPENFRAGIRGIKACTKVLESTNHEKHVQVIVTARRTALEWTDVESFFAWHWELYVVFWSQEQNLLFVNGSSNAGEYRGLAQAIAGDTATLINGQTVFRSFAEVKRLRLQNVGLTEQLGRNVRYTGRMGADVEPALSGPQLRRARKSVLAGTGFENGERTTVGASRKGRIWSHRRDRIAQLIAWCKEIGTKLLDESINPDEILRGTLEGKPILQRPSAVPLSVDWPEKVYRELESIWTVTIAGQAHSFSDVSLELVSQRVDEPLRFAVVAEGNRGEFELQLFEKADGTPDYRFVQVGETSVGIQQGGSEAAEGREFLYKHPPTFWFADGSALEGNQLIELKLASPPYDSSKIEAWDWADVNVQKEAQGADKDADSVQGRVIGELLQKEYDVVFDDDGPGEAADVVAVRRVGDPNAPSSLEVEFYHCKYSSRPEPGARIEDLYVVCGQAQKSVDWAFSPEKRTDLFTHLVRRAKSRSEAGGSSRYEVGNEELLLTLREMSRSCFVNFKIYIVQPGLSKASASRAQVELLGVTENYLKETYQVPFEVIASP